jgi:hypothetical protein
MSELSVTMYEELDAQERELMNFECWYYSVIDDMASLIRANGYDKVMYDVMCAVERMSIDNKGN